MQFDPVKIDQLNNPNTNQIVVRQINSAEKKQMNKTAQCQNCLKYMSKKTLRYSHKCGSNAESATLEASNELAQSPEPQPEPVRDHDTTNMHAMERVQAQPYMKGECCGKAVDVLTAKAILWFRPAVPGIYMVDLQGWAHVCWTRLV